MDPSTPVNLQNIPRADKTIKKAFRPKLDAFLFFDYQQIELRLLAYYMACLGDYSMAQAIRDGKDLHTESSKAALHLDREPTDEERQVGKTLNFSIVYGGGRPTLMRQLDLEWKEAGVILSNYHRRWPGIQLVNNAIQRTIEQRGYIKTLWGRHLHPESSHKALNALVQGCAADLMKAGLVKVHRMLNHVPEDGFYGGVPWDSHLVLTIHDELVIDATFAEIPVIVDEVPSLMSHEPVNQVVPIGVDCEISTETWADKTSYKEFVERAMAA